MKQTNKIWVVKVGSALLTDPLAGLNQAVLANLADQISALRKKGIAVVLVSSGAIAEGLYRLNIRQRPKAVHQLQAAAATGQMGLVHAYEVEFARHDIVCAQVLLTHADLANRTRYLNARRTLQTLLELGTVPIINENDTVVTDEIKVGDNDTLGALVANLLDAETLVILTDQKGLYTADPRQDESAALVETGIAGDRELAKMASAGGELGTGGMVTKLLAAEKAARSGSVTIIADGRKNSVLADIFKGKAVGTRLMPNAKKITARKQWLAGNANDAFHLQVDAGAAKVLQESGRSLLPIGICAAKGDFSRGDIVMVTDEAGNNIACGLVNYSAAEIKSIKGIASDQIEKILGYVGESEVIHRDDLFVLNMDNR